MIYQTERWIHVEQEFLPLGKANFIECNIGEGKIEYAPDLTTLAMLDNMGLLHLTTCREIELVGYFLSILTLRHLECKVFCANQIGVYLKPAYRKGSAGLKLMQKHEDGLKELGVQKMYGGHTIAKDLAPLFKRQKWQEQERCYIKWIQ